MSRTEDFYFDGTIPICDISSKQKQKFTIPLQTRRPKTVEGLQLTCLPHLRLRICGHFRDFSQWWMEFTDSINYKRQVDKRHKDMVKSVTTMFVHEDPSHCVWMLHLCALFSSMSHQSKMAAIKYTRWLPKVSSTFIQIQSFLNFLTFLMISPHNSIREWYIRELTGAHYWLCHHKNVAVLHRYSPSLQLKG